MYLHCYSYEMAGSLSLVAMFDDLRRNRSVLTQGIETGSQFNASSQKCINKCPHVMSVPSDVLLDLVWRTIWTCYMHLLKPFAFLEFERFVRFQNDWRRRLAASEDEKQSLRDSVAKLDNANKTLDLKLKHARTQLDSEIRKRKVAEQDMQRLVGF